MKAIIRKEVTVSRNGSYRHIEPNNEIYWADKIEIAYYFLSLPIYRKEQIHLGSTEKISPVHPSPASK